jgi:hypothetical protein
MSLRGGMARPRPGLGTEKAYHIDVGATTRQHVATYFNHDFEQAGIPSVKAFTASLIFVVFRGSHRRRHSRLWSYGIRLSGGFCDFKIRLERRLAGRSI